jgi:hypothetical protein
MGCDEDAAMVFDICGRWCKAILQERAAFLLI